MKQRIRTSIENLRSKINENVVLRRSGALKSPENRSQISVEKVKASASATALPSFHINPHDNISVIYAYFRLKMICEGEEGCW